MKRKTLLLILLHLAIMLGVKSQVPYGLNSNPSATGTIYLDFDGHTVSDYFWVGFNRDTPFYVQPSVLTRAQMIKVFNHVSEDFSPFEVNVTTDSSIYESAPINTRIRVVITPTSSWYGSAGGVAYFESYSWADPSIFGDVGNDVPCFAFDAALLKNEKRVAEVCSHEVGHTLNLAHQSSYAYEGTDTCRFAWEYNSGKFGIFPAEDLSWAPIMGVGYSRNLTLWHTGKTSRSCTDIQNDISVILRPANKIVLKKDDYTNVFDSTKYVSFLNKEYSIKGLITDSSDVDLFKFGFKTDGRFVANLKPFVDGPEIIAAFPMRGITNWNGNVDLEATLYKENNIIRVYNDTARLNVNIDTFLTAGTYYLKVNSVKNVNADKYGMIGTYNISGSFGGEITLPIRQINLSCNNLQGGTDALSWNIISDEPLESIEIQVSRDGIVWNKLTNVSVTSTSYSYKAPGNRTLYYRLLVKTIVGESKFSNQCVINKSGGQASFTIANAMIINEGVEGNWRLFDVYGNVVLSGRLINGINHINSNKITPGFYILQVIDNFGNITSKKVIK